MADPLHTIVDRIPLSGRASFIDHFNGTLYCTGDSIQRINLSTREVTVIGPPATMSTVVVAVDFHRPFPVSPDIVGSGTPDGRIYVATFSNDFVDGDGWTAFDDFEAVEITPPLLDQFSQFKLSPAPASRFRPLVTAMVVSSDGRYLYYFDVTTFQLGIVDLAAGPRMVGAVALENWSMSMVISPDDRLIYVAHPFNGYISVVDTSAWPAPVRKVPIDNGPFRLALSADGKRLFVAQSGDSGSPGDLGTGTLSVIDTATLERQQVLTGDHSTDVTLNSTGTRAYVSNSGNPGTVSVVDVTGSPRVIATIAGFTYPSFVRLSADDTRLYVLDSATSPGIAVAAV